MRKKTVSLISLLAFCIATLGIIILNGCSSDGVVEASETPLKFTILTDSTVEVATDNSYHDFDSITIPAKVRIDGHVYNVTGIGDKAFYQCLELKGIKIPESVTDIKSGAFASCTSLSPINIPASVTNIESLAFCFCDRIYFNVAPDNQKYSSEDGVLYNKDKTELIQVASSYKGRFFIPSNVTKIDDGAFDGCKGVERIEVDPDNSVYASVDGILYDINMSQLIHVPKSIKGNVAIPSSVTEIPQNAFGECIYLEGIELPSTITGIGNWTFFNCSRLSNIKIPSGVTCIGNYAFCQCSRLSSIEIPANVFYIGEAAFYRCDSLTSIEIPASVTTIGIRAFMTSHELTNINVSSDNQHFTSVNGVLYNKDKTELIKVPCAIKGDFDIPSSVTTIKESAFAGCDKLTNIEIPSSVTTIKDEAFFGCENLTSIKIPASVTSIRSNAFMDCSKLKNISIASDNSNYSFEDGVLYNKDKSQIIAVLCSIEGVFSIPSSVTSIGDYAFFNCEGLTKIEIPSNITDIGEWAFSYCKNLEIIIENSEDQIKIGYNAFEDCKSVKYTR